MKKLLVVFIAVLMLFAISVPAFAAENSPIASGSHIVIVINGINAIPQRYVVVNGDTVTVKVDPTKGTFDNWTIYKPDGTVAKVNEDFIIISGTTESDEMIVQPKTDLIICGNYNGLITDPLTGKEKESPKTGGSVVWVLASVMTAAAGVCFVTKKQLCK